MFLGEKMGDSSMYLKQVLSCIFLFCFISITTASEQILLNGTVTDVEGNPIEGALLYLADHSEIDVFTDAAGKYQFPATIPVRYSIEKQEHRRPVFQNNGIFFTITEPKTTVCIALFNLAGKCIKQLMNKTLSPKEYHVNLADNHLPPSLYVVSFQMGTSKFTQKIIIQENGMLQLGEYSGTLTKENKNRLAKEMSEGEEINDVLVCQKEGFESKNVDITDYYATVDIVLTILDTTPPVVAFFPGEDTVVVHFDDSDSLRTWMREVDIRINATDDLDDSLELLPPTNLLIDTTQPGFYFLQYGALDDAMNLGTKDRFLILFDSTKIDTDPPIFTVVPETLYLEKGDLYQDTGISVIDSGDGDLHTLTEGKTNYFIDTTGAVNTTEPGTYTITYRQIDTHRNMAMATRTVIVTETEATEPQEAPTTE
jgi:hypothetical protein